MKVLQLITLVALGAIPAFALPSPSSRLEERAPTKYAAGKSAACCLVVAGNGVSCEYSPRKDAQ